MKTELNYKIKDDIETNDWQELRFDNAVCFNPKRTIKKGQVTKFVAMNDIEPFNKKVSSFVNKNFSGGSKFKNGDTIMARITPCLENGKTAFVDFLDQDEVAGGSTEFIVLSGKDGVSDSNYVYYLAISPEIRETAIKAMTGTSGRQRVENNKLMSHVISVPPLEEQRKIAEILVSLDDKIILNNQINKNLKELAEQIFKKWFVKFDFPDENGKPYKSNGGRMIESELGEIPENWIISEIGMHFDTILGGTPSRNNIEYWNGEKIPWINSGAINDFPIITPSGYITQKGLDNSAAKLMPVKTVVLPFVISLNKEVNISMLGIESAGNQSVLGILENEKASAEYIFFWIEKIKNDIYAWATGGAQQHINKQNVDSSKIIIPPRKIMDDFRSITAPIFDKIISNSTLNIEITKTRNSLIPQLLSGRKRIN